jgi:dienelactone hydrolase
VLELAYSGAKLGGVVSFHGNLPLPTPKEARNIRASVLVLHGAEDPYVKPGELADFHKLMSDGKADWQLVEYGGVVHGYTNPRYKDSGMPGVAYDRRAENRAWQAMRDFLRERLGR